MPKSIGSFTLFGVTLLSLSAPASAYLDGATGSMLIQAVIGGVAAAGMFGRHYVAKVKTAVTTIFRKNSARRED